jgi:aspartate aminotransferase-like enzyme
MKMDVRRLRFSLDAGVDNNKVMEVLKADKKKKIKAVLVTHNETSTGVTNDIKTLGSIVYEHGALLLVDAVSSLGGIEIRADKWHLDIVISASQKAFFAAPGITMVSVSEKAWNAIDESTSPRYFFDLRCSQKSYDNNRITPYTPAISTLYGLQESLRIIKDEGFKNVLLRHKLVAKALRAGIKAIGLKLYVSDEKASNTVTTVIGPEGVDCLTIRNTMREKYHVIIAGGLGALAKSTFRIGHLGYIGRGDILNGISALELALVENGYEVPLGKGIEAVQKVFSTINNK